MTARQRPDLRPRRTVHPGRDERFDHAVCVDDPERRVARPDQRADLIDDDLEDFLDRTEAGDRPRRSIDGVVDVGCRLLVDPAHDDRG